MVVRFGNDVGWPQNEHGYYTMELNSTVKQFFVIDTLLVGTMIKSINKEGLQNIWFDQL